MAVFVAMSALLVSPSAVPAEAARATLTIQVDRVVRKTFRVDRPTTLTLKEAAFEGQPAEPNEWVRDIGWFVLLPVSARGRMTGVVRWTEGGSVLSSVVGDGRLAAGTYLLLAAPPGDARGRWTVPWTGRRTWWRPTTRASSVFSPLFTEVPAGPNARTKAGVMVNGSRGFVFTRLTYHATGLGEAVTVCLARTTPDAACPGLVAQTRAVRRTLPALAAPTTVTVAFDRAPREAGQARWDIDAQGSAGQLDGFALSLSDGPPMM